MATVTAGAVMVNASDAVLELLVTEAALIDGEAFAPLGCVSGGV
jgi:hypothetical protein